MLMDAPTLATVAIHYIIIYVGYYSLIHVFCFHGRKELMPGDLKELNEIKQ